MTKQIIQILEQKDPRDGWKVRTVLQLWPYIQEERTRLQRFIDEEPK